MTSERKGGPAKASQPNSGIKQRASRAKAVASAKIRTGSEKLKVRGEAARRKAAGKVEDFPVAALIGGLAVGAVLGALLPRTRQEDELLGSLGGAINEKAKGAVSAARDAGQAKLDELGISQNAAGKQVGKLIDSIAQVAETAGTAAVDAVRR